MGTPRVSMAGSQQPGTAMAGSQGVVWGPLEVHDGFPRGSMAGSQSVVRGPLGVPEGFPRGPWLVSNKCGSGTSGGP